MKIIAMAALLALPACVAAGQADQVTLPGDSTVDVPIEEAGGFFCDASAVQYAIGQKASGELAAKLMTEAGGEILRWIPPRTAVTQDYSRQRLNIRYDDDYRITAINCG